MPGEADVLRNLAAAKRLMEAGMDKGLSKAAEMIAEHAKTHHKYTRRSGDTEESTVGGMHQRTADKLIAVVSAGMDYDVFLEKARNGTWAFIWPAVMDKKDDVLRIIADEAKQ